LAFLLTTRKERTVRRSLRFVQRLIAGRLLPADAHAVFEWARLNIDTLVADCSGQIGTIQMAQALKPLPPSG
jgi:hypothetical protein